MHIERVNIAEADSAEELDAMPASGGKRLQFWMDREPGEVLSLAEPDPAYETALAMVDAQNALGSPRRNGLVSRVRRLLRRGRDGA